MVILVKMVKCNIINQNVYQYIQCRNIYIYLYSLKINGYLYMYTNVCSPWSISGFIYLYVVNIPICSMYGICCYIWAVFRANVGKYSMHGAYGVIYVYIYIVVILISIHIYIYIDAHIMHRYTH